ncbi:MAG: XRE family transcriptional regulator [Parcubacteria group bacterium Gr01-1014_18]|nr:MAG: XRE family transcriptional regulator [Parcubacteria group bacterium Greene0416_36]TSC79693.1 MAG: XRE family transcriptional regulator [Parcubacteria group bacterium Gr01-1014_18]TSC97859.1 MAG: XRE family transcriptional regulator [Parcubacteria group bacterium Greene1014_20]TSD06483.1 MAG: XRE family transcriptional regulator [Parcubacteria group bacterium Greene0714_2]
MVSFHNKKIEDYGTLGSTLSEKRESQRADTKTVSRILAIDRKYLDAFENGQYGVLPALVYAKNYLRAYSQYLELDYALLEGLFLKELDIYQKSRQQKESALLPRKLDVSALCSLWVIPKMARNISICCIVLFAGYYLARSSQEIFTPPNLALSTPPDNYVTREPTVTISGQTQKEAAVKVNGKLILIDESGNFSESLPLQKGMNLLEISAAKKYSKNNTVIRKIMYMDDEVAVSSVENTGTN